MSESEIEERLAALRRDPAAWNFRDQGGRWSLGGAQGKFALARRSDGSWAEPTGQSASTHIFKVGIAQFAHSDAAEFVTMRAAGSLGLTTARSDLVRFGQETAFVSRRYDRRVDGNGVVQRLHQEDLCQALGISRASKYEADGGPSVETIGRMFSEVIDPRDLDVSRRLFMKALLFNWLVAGTDAHTKNYSLLHIGSRIRLAPLYDLTAAAFLQPAKDVHFKGKLAMKLGGEYLIRNIRCRHIARVAKSLGVEPDWAMSTANKFADNLAAAVESALDEVNTLIQENQADQFRAGISARLRSGQVALTSPDSAATTSAAAADSGTPVQGIWVAPHTRSGRQIAGHWRKQPGFTN